MKVESGKTEKGKVLGKNKKDVCQVRSEKKEESCGNEVGEE